MCMARNYFIIERGEQIDHWSDICHNFEDSLYHRCTRGTNSYKQKVRGEIAAICPELGHGLGLGWVYFLMVLVLLIESSVVLAFGQVWYAGWS